MLVEISEVTLDLFNKYNSSYTLLTCVIICLSKTNVSLCYIHI